MTLFEILPPFLEQSALNILLNIILKQFLFKSYCISIVSEEPLNVNSNVSFIHLTPKSNFDDLREQLLDLSEKRCSDYIVNVEDPTVFMKAFKEVNLKGQHRRGDKKVVIVLDDDRIVPKLLAMTEVGYVPYVLVITSYSEEKCEIFNLITHEFLKDDGNKPIYLDKWNACTKKFVTNVDLFPNNIENLNGKVVKVAAFSYLPYSLLDLDTSIVPTGMDGIEIKILEEFCAWTNCSIEIVRQDEYTFGDIYPNGTGTGILGSVVGETSDFGIGGLYVWYDTASLFDFSSTFLRSFIMLVAPSPRIISRWDILLLPFSWNIWYAVVITFVISCIGLAIAVRCSKNNVMLTVFGYLINQVVDISPSWRVRSITIWLLNASLVLGCAYGAGLASVFTVTHYEPSIDTIQDMVDREMEWGAPLEIWTYSLLPSTEPKIKKLVTLFQLLPPEELAKRSNTRDLAFTVEKMPGDHYAIPAYLSVDSLLDFTIMTEELYFGDVMTLLRKGSPYTNKMSRLVGRLKQAGLLIYWETQTALKYMDFKKQEIVRLSRNRNDVGFRTVKLGDFMGVFIFYGIGLVFSISVFLVEVIQRRFYYAKFPLKSSNKFNL